MVDVTPLKRAIRHGPDRFLHSIRHRRAIRRVEKAAPRKLVVMCLGNICRSPYAEGVLARDCPDHKLNSAGFLVSGRPAPRLAISVGVEHGVNLTAHRSSQLTQEALEWADLVLVMDARQAARISAMSQHRAYIERLGDFDPGPIDTRTVMDPIDRDRDYFERVYTRIDACCRVLTSALGRG